MGVEEADGYPSRCIAKWTVVCAHKELPVKRDADRRKNSNLWRVGRRRGVEKL